MLLRELEDSRCSLKLAVQTLLQQDYFLEARDYLEVLRNLDTLIRDTKKRIDAEEGQGLTKEETGLVMTPEGLVPAIKSIRNRTGCSLVEAKELCDKYRASHGFKVGQ